MVEVICDTSFLIHLATNRILNYERFDIDMGCLKFLVPNVVLNELLKLKEDKQKKWNIEKTLEYIKNFKIIYINGNFADKEILNFIKLNPSIVGTMDKELKKNIKNNGGTIISFHNDNLVLES